MVCNTRSNVIINYLFRDSQISHKYYSENSFISHYGYRQDNHPGGPGGKDCQVKKQVFIIILIVFLISACGLNQSKMEIAIAETLTSMASATSTPEQIETLPHTPTKTLIPSDTLTPTNTQEPTAIDTPSKMSSENSFSITIDGSSVFFAASR